MNKKKLHIQIFANSDRIIGYSEFKSYAIYISNLFTFNLPPVFIKRTQKLLIELSNDEDAEFIFPNKQGESIYTIQYTLNFYEFNNASPLEKKNVLNKAALVCLSKLYKHLGLDSADVELAYKQIVANDFKLSVQLCGGIKQNKKRTIKASVTAEHLLDYVLIQIFFLDNNNFIFSKIDIFKTVPVYFLYIQLINSAKWISNDVFAISNNSKEFTLNVEINGSYTMTYNPKLRSIDGLKEEIIFLTKEVLINL